MIEEDWRGPKDADYFRRKEEERKTLKSDKQIREEVGQIIKDSVCIKAAIKKCYALVQEERTKQSNYSFSYGGAMPPGV